MKLFWFLSLISFMTALIPPYVIDGLDTKTVDLEWIPMIHRDSSGDSWGYWLFVVSWNCFNLGLVQIVSRWNHDTTQNWKNDFWSSILLYGWFSLWNMTMLKIENTSNVMYFFLGGGFLWNAMNFYHSRIIQKKNFTISVIFSCIINCINIGSYFIKYCDTCAYTDWYWVNTLFQYIFSASMLIPAWYYIKDYERSSIDMGIPVIRELPKLDYKFSIPQPYASQQQTNKPEVSKVPPELDF